MKIKTLFLALAMSLTAGSLANADVRIGAGDAMKAAVNKPSPAYSPIARQMKVSGHVEVEAVVSTDGSVETVKAVTGNPLLTQSAIQAVQKWKFTPFTANGEATRAVVTLAFDFKP
ncbi:MAG: energy transducer TonB [Bryobacteraceae bacterium]|nr:energy transducer TonB [Bryobacteraceae bacterium]